MAEEKEKSGKAVEVLGRELLGISVEGLANVYNPSIYSREAEGDGQAMEAFSGRRNLQ